MQNTCNLRQKIILNCFFCLPVNVHLFKKKTIQLLFFRCKAFCIKQTQQKKIMKLAIKFILNHKFYEPIMTLVFNYPLQQLAINKRLTIIFAFELKETLCFIALMRFYNEGGIQKIQRQIFLKMFIRLIFKPL